MRRPFTWGSIVALVLAGAPLAFGDDIYKWTDAQGQTHYSNRGGSPGQEPPPSDSDSGGEQGWESVLEKQPGGENFQDKAEATINSLELQIIRKKRDRTQAQDALEATQESIVRAQSPSTSSSDLPKLRVREANEITDLKRLDLEIASLQMSIAKIRALKAAQKEQRSTR